MDYLGGRQGTGLLLCAGTPIGQAEYDFDSYLSKAGQVTSCGETRLSPATLKSVFGHIDLQLRTDDGQLLKLRFSEKLPSSEDGAAHVDVLIEPPTADRRGRSGRSNPPSFGSTRFAARSI